MTPKDLHISIRLGSSLTPKELRQLTKLTNQQEESTARGWFQNPKPILCALIRVNKTLVGWCAIHAPGPLQRIGIKATPVKNPILDIGAFIARPNRKQGLARMAAQMILSHVHKSSKVRCYSTANDLFHPLIKKEGLRVHL